MRRVLTAATVGAVCIAVSVVAPGRPAARPSARMCSPRWRTVARPNAQTISSVAAISPTDVWLVGSTEPAGVYRIPTSPVILHWDGRAFRRYPSFTPTEGHGELTGVAGLATDDVWAVGTDDRRKAASSLVVLHWDGTSWRRMPTPRLRGSAFDADVTEISPDDVWVVGGNGADGPVVLHWNGHSWKNHDLATVIPHARGVYLKKVDGASANDVWAVGTSPSNVDFAGDYTVVVHWDGAHWRNVRAPSIDGGNDGEAIDAVGAGPTAAWLLIQNVDPARHDQQGLYLTSYDRRNRPAHTHFTDSDNAGDVVAGSATSVFVVGGFPSAGGPELHHFDGAKLHPMTATFAGNEKLGLASLSMLSPTDIWAAGDRLLARYSC